MSTTDAISAKIKEIRYLNHDESIAAIGVTSNNKAIVHIVGMFFFKSSASQISQLFSLLCKNLSNKQFAHYAVITPETTA